MSRSGAKRILRRARHSPEILGPVTYPLEVGIGDPECFQFILQHDKTSTNKGKFEHLPRVIVVMTYRREARFQNLIRQIRDLMPDTVESRTHMIIAQSVDTTVDNFTAAHELIISLFRSGQSEGTSIDDGISAEPPWLGTVEHVQTPLLLNDTSFSNDLKQFGNKRNSMRNLIAGLTRALERMAKVDPFNGHQSGQRWHKQSSNILVVEDDAVLSCDTMEFLAHAGTRMATDPVLAVASLELVTRPSVLMGNLDAVWAFENANKQPTATVTLTANQRTVVKTYAWMVSHAYAREYTELLKSADQDERGGLGTVMDGCMFCESYCYDHVSEWSLSTSKRRIIYPGVPRVRQTTGMGMTYTENPVTPIYVGGYVRERDFQEKNTILGVGVMSLFKVPGISAWRQPSNPSIVRVVYAVVTKEPLVQLLGSVACLLFITLFAMRLGALKQFQKRKRFAHLE